MNSATIARQRWERLVNEGVPIAFVRALLITRLKRKQRERRSVRPRPSRFQAKDPLVLLKRVRVPMTLGEMATKLRLRRHVLAANLSRHVQRGRIKKVIQGSTVYYLA